MQVTIIPSVKQIQRYAQSAYYGFETLSTDNAIENAKGELENLLTYLGRLHNTDDAVCESFVSGVESVVKLEFNVSNLDSENSV
jgi:hypothetical protein